MTHQSCDFCDKEIIRSQKIYEDDLIAVIYPQEPIIFYHFIIFPNRHVKLISNLTKEELIRIYSLIGEIFKILKEKKGCIGFNLISNNGSKKTGQHVPHAHSNLFLRFNDEPLSPYKVMSNILLRERLTPKEWQTQRKTISDYLRELRCVWKFTSIFSKCRSRIVY